MGVYALEAGKVYFPDPHLAEPDGLLAVGGDLSVERLILAYSHGIFPWYEEGYPYMWWCPHERYILRPGQVHVSHSMRKFMRNHRVEIRLNRDFSDTMHRCRMKREHAEGTWITDDMEKAYAALFRAGYAMSVEAYVDGALAGGLYGVLLGKGFFGESMFSDLPNGSKLALIALSGYLQDKDIRLIDCQFHTPHLESMGGEFLDYDAYMKLLRT